MDKRTEITNAMKEAMKAKDEVTLATTRMIIAAHKHRDIEARATGNTSGLGDTEIVAFLPGMIKQRQESAEAFEKGGRPELAARERAEIEVIRRFMPAQLDDAAVKKAIGDLVTELGAASVKDMGKVMAELKTRYAGQMDMARASGLVKERLSA